jgi:hypothetical protein
MDAFRSTNLGRRTAIHRAGCRSRPCRRVREGAGRFGPSGCWWPTCAVRFFRCRTKGTAAAPRNR